MVIAGQPQRAAGRRPPAAWLNRGVIIPGGAKRNLSAEKAAALLRAVQPVTAVEVEVEVVGLPQAVRCSMVGPVGWAARVVNQSVRA